MDANGPFYDPPMDSVEIPEFIRRLTYDHIKEYILLAPGVNPGARLTSFGLDEVYIVWFCFTLGNFKALLSTSLHDGRYYEVTFNRNKGEVYIDTYMKVHNRAVKLSTQPEN